MADLIDYKRHQWHNRPFRYILVVIDCFSRYAWTRPLKTKTSEESATALDSILSEMPHKPRFFASDQGNEFSVANDHLKKILIEKYKLKVYTLTGRTKSSIVERWNRTFKTRMERYFTATKQTNWVKVLQNFTKNINNTVNRTTDFAPADVDYSNVEKIRKKLYPKMMNPKPCRFKVNDIVRIVVDKNLFQKGYEHSKFIVDSFIFFLIKILRLVNSALLYCCSIPSKQWSMLLQSS